MMFFLYPFLALTSILVSLTAYIPAPILALLAKTTGADYAVGWTRSPLLQSVALDTLAPAATLPSGASRWNTEDRVIETNLDGVILQNGFETLINAANYTGATIPKGRVVAFAGVTAPAFGPTAPSATISVVKVNQ